MSDGVYQVFFTAGDGCGQYAAALLSDVLQGEHQCCVVPVQSFNTIVHLFSTGLTLKLKAMS